jgi:hypothetical protein
MVNKKSVIFLVVLGSLSIYVTLYTATAHKVARYVYEEDGTFFWRSAPSGSFFPWPREPGILEMLTRLNEIDLFIYVYLIKSGVLLGVTILLWISLSLYILKLMRVFDTFRQKTRA